MVLVLVFRDFFFPKNFHFIMRLKKSKLAQHSYEEGHKICLKEVEVFQTELSITYRKMKETAQMSLAAHPVSQLSLDTSPTWTLIIEAKDRNLEPSSIIIWESCDFILVVHRICLYSKGFCLFVL
jgi:hypothetical protein